MNNCISFERSEQLERASIMAVYKERVGRSWLLVFGGALLTVLGFAEYFPHREAPALVIGVIGLLFLVLFLWVQILLFRRARDSFRFHDEKKVSMEIEEEGLAFSFGASSSNVKLKYAKLTRFAESDGFLLLFAGGLIVASLPKSAFTGEQLADLKSRIGPARKSI